MEPPWNMSPLSEAARKQLGIRNRGRGRKGKPLAMVQLAGIIWSGRDANLAPEQAERGWKLDTALLRRPIP